MFLKPQQLVCIICWIFWPKLVKMETDWTFDLVSVYIENHTPDIIFVDLHITRPKRGFFAMSGSVDLKEDITDEFLMTVSVYYSVTGGSDFIKSPLNVPECNLTTLMNNFYKDIVMESLSKCSDQSPTTKDKFVAPITKRNIQIENCLVTNDNMPSKLRKGFYKIVFKYRQQAEGFAELLVKVEKK